MKFILGVLKRVSHESEEKLREKMKMTQQKHTNLVHVQQQYCIPFYKKTCFHNFIFLADMAFLISNPCLF